MQTWKEVLKVRQLFGMIYQLRGIAEGCNNNIEQTNHTTTCYGVRGANRGVCAVWAEEEYVSGA